MKISCISGTCGGEKIWGSCPNSRWLRAEISASGNLAWAAWPRDHGYSRRGIFGGSVLRLYRITSYKVRSAFSATAALLVIVKKSKG